jgi:hypothetical protein
MKWIMGTRFVFVCLCLHAYVRLRDFRYKIRELPLLPNEFMLTNLPLLLQEFICPYIESSFRSVRF